MKKIIAIFLPSLRGGGAERAMVLLANSFAERGLEVDLVLVSATGPYISEVSPMVNIVNFNKSGVANSLFKLVHYLRGRHPDALLSAMGHVNLIALLAKIISGVDTRVVVSERNDSSIDLSAKRNIRVFFISFFNRYLYRTANAIHAVSSGVAESSAKSLGLSRDDISVIYNPVVSPSILKLSEVNVDFPWVKKNNVPLILAAGRLTKQKDYATLIQAFNLLLKNFNAYLVILGEGELRSDLESMVSDYSLTDSVILPGFVENPFVIMRMADLFVLSSAWEGLPNVLIQAMACGTPVVSTNCPSGPAEILENGKWGRLVCVGDVDALAKAMFDSLVEAKSPDVAARACFFSVDRATDEYLKLLLPDTSDFS